MYRRLPVTLLFIYLGVLVQVSAQQTQVCPNCDYSSLSAAVLDAKPYDTIMVEKGVYNEHEIIIDKALTIIGNGYPEINGENIGSTIRIQADDVSIEGFSIKHVGFSHTEEFAGIHVQKSNGFRIENNRFENVFFGILIEASKKGVIRQNKVYGERKQEFYSGNGIHGWKSKALLIEDNELMRLRDGIYLEFVDDTKVLRNQSYENIRYGLHFMFSNDNDYEHNVFTNNGAGVAVMFSKRINMKHNIFQKNWGTSSFGLLLKEIYDAEITNNDFEENTTGIQVEGSSRINYLNNNFRNNGWAVKISGGCFTNIFESNNFLYNSFDLSYNAKVNDNHFTGNYWSSYTGYDLDRDGVGDVAYRPVKLFSYIVNKNPESITLMRSLFVDIINFSEKVSPIFTPDNLVDKTPKMKIIND
ncbi:MAG: nitrous oxide reductase family maturation protein NosD [Balneolaceae bacterium]|nr:nitrous oxide reductase family maturation protein NosD [Balneolaceae bacterium]MBO6547089.1 nitrous oxide reductase family maturation protein NosD [Balneolaceae bacterium]MBO6647964.1 nitrous oxide reductase family maturation protein NosD [Balneolaceae bacterium]